MITPPTDPQPGEVWRYFDIVSRQTVGVRILEELPSPESTKRYLAQLVSGPYRGQTGIVYRDMLREKTDEL